MPKLYFYDTGLAIALLGFENERHLETHPFRGNFFENLIIVEFLKRRFNAGNPGNLFFWRDNVGNEIDLLLADGNSIIPVEIKSGQTITNDYFKGILYWNKMTQTQGGYVVYGGISSQIRGNGIKVLPISDIAKFFS